MPKDTILATNPGQKLMVSPINKIYNDSDDVKFFCLFIEPNKIRNLSNLLIDAYLYGNYLIKKCQ